jgi:tRNA (guanine37-N1)-methyltransferase
VRFAKVFKSKAEEVRRMLISCGAIDVGFEVIREGDYIFFPLKDGFVAHGLDVVDYEPLKRILRPQNLRDCLRDKIPPQILHLVPSSYSVVGDIAVIELPEEVLPSKKIIGDCMLSCYPGISVVALKTSPVSGDYRVPGLEVVAGEDRTATVHRENSCLFSVDLARVYFNPRTGGERMRVASQISSNERVLVLFAGVGPYAVLAAKRGAQVWAVEINPDAVEYMRENAKLNRVQLNVLCSDVSESEIPTSFFDRIIMPLPKAASGFLDAAFSAIKQEGIIHYYCFAKNSIEASGEIVEAASELGFHVEVLSSVECGAYSPCLSKYCVDIRCWSIEK